MRSCTEAEAGTEGLQDTLLDQVGKGSPWWAGRRLGCEVGRAGSEAELGRVVLLDKAGQFGRVGSEVQSLCKLVGFQPCQTSKNHAFSCHLTQ